MRAAGLQAATERRRRRWPHLRAHRPLLLRHAGEVLAYLYNHASSWRVAQARQRQPRASDSRVSSAAGAAAAFAGPDEIWIGWRLPGHRRWHISATCERAPGCRAPCWKQCPRQRLCALTVLANHCIVGRHGPGGRKARYGGFQYPAAPLPVSRGAHGPLRRWGPHCGSAGAAGTECRPGVQAERCESARGVACRPQRAPQPSCMFPRSSQRPAPSRVVQGWRCCGAAQAAAAACRPRPRSGSGWRRRRSGCSRPRCSCHPR